MRKLTFLKEQIYFNRALKYFVYSQPVSNQEISARLDGVTGGDPGTFLSCPRHLPWTRCWAQCPWVCRDDEYAVIALVSLSRVGFGGCHLKGPWEASLSNPLWRLHCPPTVCSFPEEATVAQGREMGMKETV